ncbi:uncharacterized protein LOC117106814 [Anneissia japonica]|uniref:uncharacterized protein LOC117106814 n=1 Tax=Anneissia japonica TaxID=1529436 RepID=UPI0014254CE2|nr:uncharacterized protein LOC117106814 [Anneissia japonica]
MNSLRLVLMALVVACVSAKHYRGGTFSWEPAEDGKVDIHWRVSWMRIYEGGNRFMCSDEKLTIIGEGRLLCMECDQHDIYGKELNLNCTSWDELENWSTGVGTFKYTPEPGMRQFTLSYQESETPNKFTYNSQWMQELKNYGGAGNAWRMVTTVDLDIPNNSPRTTHPAMITLMKECGDVSIQIPVADPDDDDVRCRWTNKDNECPKQACNSNGGGCSNHRMCGDPFPGATVDENECRYSFPVSQMEPGWYAVPITLEDHRRGVTGRLESGALSKIPLQFLIKVESKGECRNINFGDYKRCHVITPGQDWSYELKAYSSHDVKIMVIERPNLDFNMTPLEKKGNHSSRVVSWTPKESDLGKHFVLFHAVDNDGYYSSYETLTILVKPQAIEVEEPTPPKLLPMDSYPAPLTEVTPDMKKWKIKFDKAVVRPNKPTFISIMDTMGNVAAKYDVSDKQQVKITKNKPDIMAIDNPYSKLKPGTAYVLSVDQGTAGQKCVDACGYDCGFKPSDFLSWLITTPPTPEPSVECGPSSLTVYIPRDYVEGVGPNKLRFIDAWDRNCYAKSYNSTHYIMKTGFEECGTFSKEPTPGRLIFTNIVRDVPKAIAKGLPVTRTHRMVKINVTCEVEGLSYYDVSFTPSDAMEAFTVRGISRLNTLLKLYEDDTYSREYRKEDLPASVELKERMFFGLEAVNKAKDLQIVSCTATQRQKPGCKPEQYTFIKDGCPVDSTVRFEQAYSRYEKRFSVEAFSFLFYGSTEEVLVKCKTAICKPGDLSSLCTQLSWKSCPSDTILIPGEADVMADVMLPVSG